MLLVLDVLPLSGFLLAFVLDALDVLLVGGAVLPLLLDLHLLVLLDGLALFIVDRCLLVAHYLHVLALLDYLLLLDLYLVGLADGVFLEG